jgi:hypothetical protein
MSQLKMGSLPLPMYLSLTNLAATKMLHFSTKKKKKFKSWFSNDTSLSHKIYCFEKCIINSWNDDTSFENQFLRKKKKKKKKKEEEEKKEV